MNNEPAVYRIDRARRFPKARPELFTASETAEVLKVTAATVYALVRRGRLVGVKVTEHALRFTREDIERFIEQSRTGERSA